MAVREDGGKATAAGDLERVEEVAKKFGIPEDTAAGGANVVGGGADAEVLGMAAPLSGLGLGMIGGARESAAVSVGSTGFDADSAGSVAVLAGTVVFVSENGRELTGGSFALVTSCGIAASFAKVNPTGIWKVGALFAASSSIFCSAARESSISSSSSS